MALNQKMAKKKFGTPRVPLKLTAASGLAPVPSVLTPDPSPLTPVTSKRTASPERASSASVWPNARVAAPSKRPAAPDRAPTVPASVRPGPRVAAPSKRPAAPDRAPTVSFPTSALSERTAALRRRISALGARKPALWKRTPSVSVRTAKPSERTPVTEAAPAGTDPALLPEHELPPWKRTPAPWKRHALPERAPSPERGPRRYRARINRTPVLDRDRVQELAGQVQSQARLLEFLNLFLVLLPSRVASVVSALEGPDGGTATAAASASQRPPAWPVRRGSSWLLG